MYSRLVFEVCISLLNIQFKTQVILSTNTSKIVMHFDYTKINKFYIDGIYCLIFSYFYK